MTKKNDQSENKPVGDVGEDFVEWACHAPFGKDFLFRGQKYRDTKGDIELSDLLLLLDDTAILMEVKTADRVKRPDRTVDDWVKWANARIEQALSQIERGVKAIRTGLVKKVKNDRQGEVLVDPSKIQHFYGIAIVDHPQLDKWGKGPTIVADGAMVSVLTTTHSELMDLLTELSTPGDLIDYLIAREKFFAKHMLMGNTEMDLLAAYKGNPDELLLLVEQKDFVVVGEGNWEAFSKMEMRQKRTEMDRPSILVDLIIDKLHEGRHAKLPHIEERRIRLGQFIEPVNAYSKVASELAKIRRIDRRVIGEGLIEKSTKCIEQKRDRWFANSPMTRDGATVVFMVSSSDREVRMQSLEMAVMGAMLKCRSKCVVGVVTEPVVGGSGFSVDAFMITGDPDHFQRQMSPDLLDLLLKKYGAPYKPEVTEFGGHASPD